MIESGRVLVGGAPADKAGRLVGSGEAVVVTGPPLRYVGRGGDKLEAGLTAFGIDPAGLTALDAGSSTGGFTDCLLQAGAAAVVAVDVGRGQLHPRLRSDPRVRVHERTDIRAFAGSTSERFRLIVADLSFISVRTVASALVSLADDSADMVVLIKPQFEAGRAEASRGRGVIRDPDVWRRSVKEAIDALEAAGAANIGVMVSPLCGADGNVEFLAHFRALARGDGPGALPDRGADAETAARVTAAVEGATRAGSRGSRGV